MKTKEKTNTATFSDFLCAGGVVVFGILSMIIGMIVLFLIPDLHVGVGEITDIYNGRCIYKTENDDKIFIILSAILLGSLLFLAVCIQISLKKAEKN